MGYASYTEDIQELRSEKQHLLVGFDAAIRRAEKARTSIELDRTSASLDRDKKRLLQILKRVKDEARKAFEEAEALLGDSRVRLTKALAKKRALLDDERQRRKESEVALDRSRHDREKLRTRCAELETQNLELRSKLDDLRDNEVAWREEVAKAAPLRKR